MTGTGQPLGDGDISEEKLRQLLALGGELDDLDLKEYLDLSVQEDKVELIKDFGAFQSHPTGGYILVGVDGSGTPSTAFGSLQAASFDPANLTQLARNYLPTIKLSATTHIFNGVTIAVICIAPPDPPGIAIFVKDGQYPHPSGKGTKTVFRAGDVFVRSGTQSIRWTPTDLPRVLSRWEEFIREDERRRASAYAQTILTGQRGRAIASGPVGALTWRLPSGDFEAGVLEAVRAQDSITLRALVLEFAADGSALIAADDVQEFQLLLDRLTAALALTITYELQPLFEQVLSVLTDIYVAAVDPLGNAKHAPDHRFADRMWRIAVAVEALGGLAVRLDALWAVRPLAMPTTRLINLIREPSWMRHAVTRAAGVNLLYTASAGDPQKQVPIGGPLVAVARQLVERIDVLRPDAQVSPFILNAAPDEDDRVLDSLIQFDVYWCLAAVARSGNYFDQFPSASAFYARRAAPAFERLITDADARDFVLREDADNLKLAIRIVAETAESLSWNDYHRPWSIRDSPIIAEYFDSEGEDKGT